MKHKGIMLFFVLAVGAAFFAVGIQIGSSCSAANGQVYAVPDKRMREESGKIAVVNLDEGVTVNGKRVNYAEKLSRFPGTEFEYASLEAARTGLESGKYGAYVIIPAVFSQNVESINSSPQVSELEYAVNQSFSARKQYEFLYLALSYAESLNNNVSYMYVNNILKEFHEAQDSAGVVMENDLKDTKAIESIEVQDLVALVEMPEMHEKENKTEMLDISEYVVKDNALTAALDEEYQKRVFDIQEEIISLGAQGSFLHESLNDLLNQMPQIDVTVDEKGVDIIEQAEGKLREELCRQIVKTEYKERIVECLTKLREVYLEEKDNSGDSLGEEYDSEVPVELIQEIEALLEELENVDEPDIDGVCELVEKEYAVPIKANVDEAQNILQQRYEEEKMLVAEYNKRLMEFCPQIEEEFLSQSIQDLSQNHTAMQEALKENNQAYMEYAREAYTSASEEADKLRSYVEQLKKETDAAVESGLKEAKKIKEETSLSNKSILADFSSKLPYTRLGGAEYERVYRFIANPLATVDRSLGRAESTDKENVVEKGKRKGLSMLTMMCIVMGILILALVLQIYFYTRRKKR